MVISVQKVQAHAKLPQYAHQGDAGLDLFTSSDLDILPGQRQRVATGIALAIPPGHVGLIWDKSGLADQHGLTTLAGVIDSGYRGEIQVVMLNTSTEVYHVTAGQKIAQLLIQPITVVQLQEVSTLPDTARAANGFGSTGV